VLVLLLAWLREIVNGCFRGPVAIAMIRTSE
jgi:hypothetical protein